MRQSFISSDAGAVKRDVKKVPFVELFGGRVQGVVSSGSDVMRVYVSWLAAKSGRFYCSTNNNRPCGGLRGQPCKHIETMLDEAAAQFGEQAVAGYLGVDPAQLTARDVATKLGGSELKEPAGAVFSRFLSYLRLCELESRPGLVTEMSWFG
jgi:hypothetical protein